MSSISFKTSPPKNPIFMAEIAAQPYNPCSKECAAGRYEM